MKKRRSLNPGFGGRSESEFTGVVAKEQIASDLGTFHHKQDDKSANSRFMV